MTDDGGSRETWARVASHYSHNEGWALPEDPLPSITAAIADLRHAAAFLHALSHLQDDDPAENAARHSAAVAMREMVGKLHAILAFLHGLETEQAPQIAAMLAGLFQSNESDPANGCDG